MADRTETDYLNGLPELLALRLLARQPMHGYELIQAIKLASGGVLSFGEGCLYPVLHRLEAEGWLAAARGLVNGRSRVVYRVTPAGLARLAARASRFEQVSAAVTAVLRGDGDAQAMA